MPDHVGIGTAPQPDQNFNVEERDIIAVIRHPVKEIRE